MKEKYDKLEAERNELKTKLDTSVDLDTLHQVKQDKHKLQKEVPAPSIRRSRHQSKPWRNNSL